MGEDEAETDVVYAVVGGFAVAFRRAAVPGVVAPKASAVHAERAAVRSSWVGL